MHLAKYARKWLSSAISARATTTRPACRPVPPARPSAPNPLNFLAQPRQFYKGEPNETVNQKDDTTMAMRTNTSKQPAERRVWHTRTSNSANFLILFCCLFCTHLYLLFPVFFNSSTFQC